MKFVDRATIIVKSGNGGPGRSGFWREKYVPKGGPDGGDGGDGGSVIFMASHRLQTLMDLKMKRIYRAKDGEPGGTNKKYGSRGEDTVVHVPLGTMVFLPEGELLVDLCHEGDHYVVAKGGKGGKGNAKFATSVNRAPRYAQPGIPGEEKRVVLEMRMIAQVGLVGLPNAGKSTLLHVLTQANPKIADYPFTTLYPNLGVLRSYNQEIVIADIPGLIEGASQGAGLGFEFLRHVARTKLLVHLIDVSTGDPEVCWEHFQTVVQEIKLSSHELKDKADIVVLTKIDTITPETLEEIMKKFRKHKKRPLAISASARLGLDELIQRIYKDYAD